MQPSQPKESKESKESRGSRQLRWGDLLLVLLLAILAFGFYRQIIQSSEVPYRWNWERVMRFFVFETGDGNWQAGPLLQGLFSTLKLAVYSIVIALLIGIPAGILQVQRLRFLRLIGQFYVEIIRNIPPLVVVTVFYFFFASPLVEWLEGVSRDLSPNSRPWFAWFLDIGNGQNNLLLGNFVAAVIILGIYEGSYIAEI
ncbi:MAG: ABC transporter permease subunit, partial [Spirochaetota bacterium]